MIASTEIAGQVFCHRSPVGPMRSVWTEAGLYSLSWDREGDDRPAVNRWIIDGDRDAAVMLDELLCEYFATGDADFGSIDIDARDWTPFRRQVYRCCRAIRAGSTLSYKQLAGRSGSPSASRAVGAAMASNRILLVIPCHRVVGSAGQLCGFSGPGGLAMKRFLLGLESRRVNPDE